MATKTELATLTHLLSEITDAVKQVKQNIKSANSSLVATKELSYPKGISLLSLKNHLLLSYLHALLHTFSLKLTATSLQAKEGADLVNYLVKLRVVLEKVAPLETKLNYQIQKLITKADQTGTIEDVLNGALVMPYCMTTTTDVLSRQIPSRSDRIPAT